jgi:hypothetical protein
LSGIRQRVKEPQINADENVLHQDEKRYITNALAAINPKDIIGWFTHCWYYIAPN